MQFNAKNIKEQAEVDFEKTWLDTAKLLKTDGRVVNWDKSEGKKHPLQDQNIAFRNIFLSYGFSEVELPSIVREEDVYKQYGPEAPLILDRVFYLAGLPRMELGISEEKKNQIRQIIPNFEKFDKLGKIFRDYKKGEIEGDSFIEELVKQLEIEDHEASQMIYEVFPEFRNLEKIATNLTLRSHMTASWFEVLSKMQRTSKLPLKLFSIGKRYRREQKLDSSHLYESTSASIVVMADDITLEDGKDLTVKILNDLGFKTSKIVSKKTTSKYYAPGMDLEVYAKCFGKELEVANLGFYSPVTLAKYKIWYPVLNLGFGVERIAMILGGVEDIRKLVYPEMY
jgi:O-phosphoseryl-tRNA synthetase